MTIKEKIEKAWELVNSKHIETNDEIQLVRFAVRMARELVERDTPMKLIENRVTDFNTHNQWGVLHCPKCSCVVVHSTYLMPQTLPNYCEVCGQKLNWE